MKSSRRRAAVVGAFLLAVGVTPSLDAQSVETVQVVSKLAERKARIPGELQPYQVVALRARVTGFVDELLVDRGSRVRKGDVLATLSAPEMTAQVREAESRARALDAQAAEAAAKLEAAESTSSRLTQAAATQGAVAGNEIVQAQKAVEAARSLESATKESARAAHEAASAVRELQSYLRITAPFDGVVTERAVHPGALVGPSTGPVVTIEQQQRLRLVVAVPEADLGWVARGDRITFTVPAHPAESFTAEVARLSGSVDPKTRTMAVELDVANPTGVLASGMFADTFWTLHRAAASLLVPPSAVVTTTERTFVIRVRGGRAEWVTVRKGAASADLVEVTGALQDGDEVVRRGTDEIRAGATVTARRAAK
jgi:membrane fusion protein, multidrug efflux system